MKFRKIATFVILFSLVYLFLVNTNITYANSKGCIFFFYGEGCQSCAKVKPFIEKIEKEREDVEIHKFEIYGTPKNRKLLNDFFDAYNVPKDKRWIPAVFTQDKWLTGPDDIKNKLEDLIESAKGGKCPSLTPAKGGTKTHLTLLTVIGAALVDSINPCAIAVLLILLSGLIYTEEKRRVLLAGLSFTLSIYISYFLFGLGIFSALRFVGVAYWFTKAVGIFGIIIGLANIKDYFWYGGLGFVTEIPRKWRPTMKMILRKASSPWAAFLAGFIVCLFELPCTGGPYLFILGLLADKTTRLQTIPILLLYNLFFVLPLLLITLFIYTGYSTIENTAKWRDKNLRKLHLIAGIVMLALGIIVLTVM